MTDDHLLLIRGHRGHVTQQYVLEMARASPVRTTVVYLRNGNRDEQLAPDEIVLRIGRTALALASLGIASPSLVSQVDRLRPSFLQAHSGFDLPLTASLASRMSVPMIGTFHGSDLTLRGWSLVSRGTVRSLVWAARRRAILRDLRHANVVSEFLAGVIVRRGYEGNPPAVTYLPRSFTGSPAGAKNPGTSVTIGYIGRLSRQKHPMHLLRAVVRLRRLGWRPSVLFVGPRRLGLAHRVYCRLRRIDSRCLGPRPESDIQSILKVMDVLCVPSGRSIGGAEEGLGLVYVEAVQSGVPSVAYNVGGVSEVPGVLTARPHSVRSLTDMVHTALLRGLTEEEVADCQRIFSNVCYRRVLDEQLARLRLCGASPD